MHFILTSDEWSGASTGGGSSGVPSGIFISHGNESLIEWQNIILWGTNSVSLLESIPSTTPKGYPSYLQALAANRPIIASTDRPDFGKLTGLTVTHCRSITTSKRPFESTLSLLISLILLPIISVLSTLAVMNPNRLEVPPAMSFTPFNFVQDWCLYEFCALVTTTWITPPLWLMARSAHADTHIDDSVGWIMAPIVSSPSF